MKNRVYNLAVYCLAGLSLIVMTGATLAYTMMAIQKISHGDAAWLLDVVLAAVIGSGLLMLVPLAVEKTVALKSGATETRQTSPKG